ncbi:MAG: GNAT family N-acetyltransferase [Cyclobacteriaceae bacterium]
MEIIELNGIDYQFISDFKHNENIRTSFNRLTSSTFWFSLESWYQEGFWGDYYVPYSLLHNDQVVSNVSINKLEFDIEGQRKLGIQIGTVMTDQKYRHKGLNKIIMERVLKEWREQVDFLYLFANDTVLDFYPKFNFEVVAEYQYTQSVDYQAAPKSLKKLNIENESDKTLLMETVRQSVAISKVSMRNNVSMIMFYAMSFKKDCFYYLKELDVVAIAEYEDDMLHLNDIFSKNPIDIKDIIRAMSNEKIKKVALGFTPLDETNFDRDLIKGEDTLFMLKDKDGYPKDKPWMFPLLSHA